MNFAEVREELDKKLYAPALTDPTAPPSEFGQTIEDEAAFAALGSIPLN